ncbi:hypothetical protein V3C99_008630 [Haemonchus contortus]
MPKSLLPPLLAPPIQEITIPTLRFPSAATVISVTSKSTPDHFHDGLLQFYRTDIRLLNVSVQGFFCHQCLFNLFKKYAIPHL